MCYGFTYWKRFGIRTIPSVDMQKPPYGPIQGSILKSFFQLLLLIILDHLYCSDTLICSDIVTIFQKMSKSLTVFSRSNLQFTKQSKQFFEYIKFEVLIFLGKSTETELKLSERIVRMARPL